MRITDSLSLYSETVPHCKAVIPSINKEKENSPQETV